MDNKHLLNKKAKKRTLFKLSIKQIAENELLSEHEHLCIQQIMTLTYPLSSKKPKTKVKIKQWRKDNQITRNHRTALKKQLIEAVSAVINSYKFKGNVNKKNQILFIKEIINRGFNF